MQIVIVFVDSVTKTAHKDRLSQDLSVLAKDVSQDMTALAKCITKTAQAQKKKYHKRSLKWHQKTTLDCLPDGPLETEAVDFCKAGAT